MNKWLKSIILTILSAATIKILIFLFGMTTLLAARDTPAIAVPMTFHMLWETIALIGVATVAKRFGLRIDTYCGILLVGAILSGVVWVFLPPNLHLPKDRYYGISSRYDNESPTSVGNLYERNDADLRSEYYDRKNSEERVSTEGFLFWQTGMAMGYDPIFINGYNGGAGFLNKLELFFTVGPLVVVESLINGITTIFPVLMLTQVIFVWRRNEHVWWDKEYTG